jgi:carboxyl-terminal processing protease
LLLLIVAFFAGCATPPSEYREPPPLAAEERSAHNLRIFDRVWELVDQKYFDASFRGVDWAAMRVKYEPEAVSSPDDEALYRVLNKMCGELKESHLTALTPRRAHEKRAEHRPAIGLRWTQVEGRRVVTDVLRGGPAERAGVKRGWLLVSRNGVPMREDDPFVTRVGHPVQFEFIDNRDRVRMMSIVPELVSFEALEARKLEGGFVYLRFDEFSHQTVSWLRGKMREHRAAAGIILDLRENRGGNTFALRLALAEFFPRQVPEGRVIKRNGDEDEEHSFVLWPTRYDGSVWLLVGPGTGSAAEIFSHVLQFHNRAPVIGRRTAGAVIYSRSFRLPGGGELQVPVSDYIGLDGQRLEGRGVTPDIELPLPSLVDRRLAKDLEMEKVTELLRAHAEL